METKQIERSKIRIAYEKNVLAQQEASLPSLKADSKAHANRVASMQKRMALIVELEANLTARLQEQADELAAAAFAASEPKRRKGTSFEIVVGDEPAGDVELDVVAGLERDQQGRFIPAA